MSENILYIITFILFYARTIQFSVLPNITNVLFLYNTLYIVVSSVFFQY